MNRQPTVLILTAQYGNGHYQTAQTLKTGFLQKGIDQVYICDLYGEAYPGIDAFAKELLRKSFSKFGAPLYKMFYYGTDKLSSKGLAYFYQHAGKKRLIELIELYRPTVILTTFPLQAAPYLKSKERVDIPTYTVITDYCVHPLWLHPMIHRYFVATDEVKEALMDYGINHHSISVSGIPIRDGFNQHNFSYRLKMKYGLHPRKKTILFVGGGLGILPNMKNIIHQLSKNKQIQLVIVCGKNKEMEDMLRPLAFLYPGQVHLVGYIDDIHELFLISDCLVSKPGAISLTEAAATSLPLVIYKPNPGQEKENAKYFIEKGAALLAQSEDEIISQVERVILSSDVSNKMKENLMNISKTKSKDRIVEEILHITMTNQILTGGGL
ncbi:hypothetical protein Q75_08220 [Bacillus coahuilensis p1.1.43]|uniref:Diacylglycerol glucosyltransferase n=1 Tax=Bacillus coahuilensis p1.1.43 TaxID=1150625 RepID=A0A147K8H8_9BACI|nr:glycosyltransferase [Bacillus coahuilensis]KUP06502.1 hypothetical protein Q75_08220 [Bacillus coahuilensis p1.1.43]